MNSRPTESSSMESFPTQVWGLTRNYEDRDPAVPTENAYVIFVMTNKEGVDESSFGEESPSGYAEVQFIFHEVEIENVRVIEGPDPTDDADAELWVSPESAGARVPARYTRHLLDVATYAVTAAGLVWAPKATLEMAGATLPVWAVLLIVLMQITGVVWFGKGLVRRMRNTSS